MNDEEKKDPKDTIDSEGDNFDRKDKNSEDFDSSETVKFSEDSLAGLREGNETQDPFDVDHRDDSTQTLDSQQIREEKDKEQAIKEMWRQYEQEANVTDKDSAGEKPVPEVRDDRTVIRLDEPPRPAQAPTKPPVPDYLAKHQRKQRKSKGPVIVLLFFFIIAVVAVAYYFYSRSQNNQSDIPATSLKTQSDQQQSPASDAATKEAAQQPAQPLVELNVDDLLGISPLNIAEKGAIFSDQMDPEAVAIAKAFKNRIKMYQREQTRTSRRATTKTISGKLRGFTIRSVLTYKKDKLEKNQLTVITPSRGSLVIENDILISAKKTDYERFFRDLRRAGIQVLRKGDPNQSGDFRVQLTLTPLPNQTVADGFVIAFNRAGPVELGMRATQLDRIVPPRYNIVRKKILIDDQYVNIHKVFNEQNKALLLLSVTENRIKTVQIIDSAFKTSQGIGVGNSLADLKLNHLNLQMGKTTENVIFAVIKGMNAKFMLSGSGGDFENQVFPNTLKITSIVLEN